MFVYREGWTDLGFSSIYCNDYASVMPTKYSYLLFDWKKDRRTEVTFMSPLNGDPATSIDGRAYGRNWFESTNGVNVAKGDTVIYFPVPGESGYKQYTDAEKAAANNRGRFSIIILRVLMLMLEMMIIIKPVIKALMQNHVFGFLFGNLKIVIPVITVREQ